MLAALDEQARRVYRQMVKAGYTGYEARQAARDDYKIRMRHNGKTANKKAKATGIR